MINRSKKLKNDDEITAENIEKVLSEISDNVPVADDYLVNGIEKKDYGTAKPPGQRIGEIRFDISKSTKRLIVPLEIDGVTKMFSVNLTEL